jgi:hypothetical protein
MIATYFQYLSITYLERITALSLFLKMYTFREHIWKDLTPFLNAESFQILDILCLRLWTALFISNHRSSMGFKSRD